jgi:hypothetical protein
MEEKTKKPAEERTEKEKNEEGPFPSEEIYTTFEEEEEKEK